MGKALVTLVNANRIRPVITPYALDILTTSLEQAGFDVEVVDLNLSPETWSARIADYFESREPALVGVTIRNTDTIYPQEQKVFLGEHRQIIAAIRRRTGAPIVAGGVGFSSMPFGLVDYFGIDYGVKGPGEEILVQLATAVERGNDPKEIPGLIINEGGGRVTRVPVREGGSLLAESGFGEDRVWQVNRGSAYVRRSGDPSKVDNLFYYQNGGLGNILTKNGCPFACAHCVEPDAKGNRFARRATSAVVDEMESLTGQGVYDLHSTDSEFNLAIANSKAILQEIVHRKDADATSPLHQLRLWIYAQPAPFDAELAELLARAGCRGINIAPDHVRDDLLDGWKVTARGTRYYTFADTERVVDLAHRYGMLTMIEVLLGMPGETVDTMRECVDRTMALNATVTGYTLGLRVFPYSPLGFELARRSDGIRPVPGVQSNTATEPIVLTPAEACTSVVEYEKQFMFEASGQFRPVYFFSPELLEAPETVARPDGRWQRTVDWLWKHIPESDHPRIMLPTAPGLSQHDNNYADNPFLTSLTQLGYQGAFWSRWREREQIIQEARDRGVALHSGT